MFADGEAVHGPDGRLGGTRPAGRGSNGIGLDDVKLDDVKLSDVKLSDVKLSDGGARPVFRIVIAEDHPAMRVALVELLGSHPQLRIVAVAEDAAEAISFCASHRPDLAVLDAAMPMGGGAFAAEMIRRASPTVRIVGLTAYTDERTRSDLLRSGATAVLHKGAGEDIAQRLVDLSSSAR